MDKAITEELNKYWKDLPEKMTDKEAVFLLKASHALDFHKEKGTESEAFLSSPQQLLEIYHKSIEEVMPAINNTMNAMMEHPENLDIMMKLQNMMEQPFYMSAQNFEENSSLPDRPLTKDDIKEFKKSFSQEQLNNMLLPAHEITEIRKKHPEMKFSQAHDCFASMQAIAEFHFGEMMGKDLKASMELSKEGLSEQHDLRNIVMQHPREVLVLTDGYKDTKIHGLGDFIAKINTVKEKAQDIDATDLAAGLNKLQKEKLSGMDKKMGIGGEFKETLVINPHKNIASER